MTKYDHKRNLNDGALLREIVFGLEDGMVSTLGAITGIAIGSRDHFTVILAGIVIIAVESISMGIGSYLSNRSEQDVNARKLEEENIEITEFPEEEKKELYDMFVRDGWPEELARQMTAAAAGDRALMLKEMAYRELEISSANSASPLKHGLAMYVSYVIGGLVPLSAYFFMPMAQAVGVSVPITLAGLFMLGAATTKYTSGSWVRSGLRILVLGGVALIVGFLAGKIASLAG